jgi:putative membrane protein
MKTKKPILRCALVAAALSCAGALVAQTTSGAVSASANSTNERNAATSTSASGTTRSSANLKDSDHNFFEKAAKSGMKEVAVSQAALPNLKNAQVKAFAEMMVSDHGSANSELMALAARKGVDLPAKEPKLDNKWSKADDDLDEEYMETMVSDHKDAVDLFEKAAKSNDADIAAFAQKTLPTLRLHLEQAKELKKLVD